jgi:hypothetical protein
MSFILWHLVGVCRVQANLSHLGGLVHFGGKQCRLGGFGPFWREAISSIWAGSVHFGGFSPT